MSDGINNKTVVSNLIWRFAERCGAQGVGFVISIVLARLLMPEEFGVIALMNVFINLMGVFVDCGLASSVIQKKNADELDYSSVFVSNVVCSIVVYIIIFVTAPFIADFYENSEMSLMLRVLGLSVIIASLKNIQQAYVTKHLLFKKFFYSTLIGTILSGVVGIVFAYMGFGVWALIFQSLINTIVDTAMLWIIVGWYPKWKFSFERFKELFSYGGKLLLSSILDTLYANIQSLIIGKKYTEADLAFYTKGKQMPELLITNINASLDSVLFPVMSDVQEEKEKLKAITRKAIQTSTSLIWPILAAVIASAFELVHVVLTDKWSGCIIFLQIFCLSYAFWPIHTANLNAIKAYGQSGTFLKQEIIKKTLGITVLLLVFDKGVGMIAVSVLCLAPINAFINWFPNYKNISYKMPELFKDIGPALGMAAIEFIVIFTISFLKINIYLKLSLQIIVGVLLYFLMMYLFRKNIVGFIFKFVRKKS